MCYHYKLTPKEAVLGVGVLTERTPGGYLKSLSVPCVDLLSSTAFEDGVRKGVWGETFTHFLPVILGREHAAASFVEAPKYFAQIMDVNENFPLSKMAFTVIPKLMNSVVVALMAPLMTKDQAISAEDKKTLLNNKVSEKALQGYLLFHHMLLWYGKQFPYIRTSAEEAINEFIRDPTMRYKDKCPNLGEWLVLLSLSNVSWDEVSVIFLKECFIRNVRWALEKDPVLKTSLTVEERLQRTWSASITSMRLIMFQVYFLTLVRPPHQVIDQTLFNYNNSCGIPNNTLKTKLFKAVDKIFSIDNWSAFFQFTQTPEPPADILCEQLETAMKVSLQRGYHTNEVVPTTTTTTTGRGRGSPSSRGGGRGRGFSGGRGSPPTPEFKPEPTPETAFVGAGFRGRGKK